MVKAPALCVPKSMKPASSHIWTVNSSEPNLSLTKAGTFSLTTSGWEP